MQLKYDKIKGLSNNENRELQLFLILFDLKIQPDYFQDTTNDTRERISKLNVRNDDKGLN